ncbi:hypothetical protein NC652_023981 [Populus alba x Populus x berolinensis]|nr:hypothetical protein NC652_023979 [Populus alba x Populus x berolinensis]KAJ6906404.1 hypothetical protein NC652_023981 [Populus alba x Populus x berolinensis]
MGALDHLPDFFDCSGGGSKHKKRKNLQVRIDCEGCERKVKRALEGMKGVKQVVVERKANKVTVVGYVEPSKVVARVAHRTGKKAELWPYVPYDMVAHPYAPGVYDKKAPAGYVRNADDPQVSQLARASSFEVRYTTAFSDENPAACVVILSHTFQIPLALSCALILYIFYIIPASRVPLSFSRIKKKL